MRQVPLFYLFMVMVILGTFTYFFPKQQPVIPLKAVMDSRGYDMTERSNTKGSRQLNMTMDKGIVQMYRQVDDLTREQKRLMGIINYDQHALNDTNKEISGILKNVDGKNYTDVLKLRILRIELQSDQRLLGEHGQQLTALNDQLNKNRQLLAEERDLVNIYSGSSLQLLQQNNSLHNGQSVIFFDKVARQNNDFLQHTQDLIDEDRQKAPGQQNR